MIYLSTDREARLKVGTYKRVGGVTVRTCDLIWHL